MERQESNKYSANRQQWKFICNAAISCRDLKLSFEELFRGHIEIIFEREIWHSTTCYSGIFGIPNSGPNVNNTIVIEIGSACVKLIPITQESFNKANELENRIVQFTASREFTKREYLSSFFSQFGQITNLVTGEISRNKVGFLQLDGQLTFSKASQLERLLLELPLLPSGISITAVKLPKMKKLSVKPGLKRGKGGSSERPSQRDKKPKLDFTKCNDDRTKRGFGGYHIRPYLKTATNVALKSTQSQNIRFNLLSPNATSRLQEARNVQTSDDYLQ